MEQWLVNLQELQKRRNYLNSDMSILSYIFNFSTSTNQSVLSTLTN